MRDLTTDKERRDTCMRIAEVVRHIDGGKEYGDVFLTGFYPYEAEYVPEELRLTKAKVRKALEFLRTLEAGMLRQAVTVGTVESVKNEEREEVADQLERLLDAVPEDGDGPLRAQIAAYVAGLRGELPEPSEGD